MSQRPQMLLLLSARVVKRVSALITLVRQRYAREVRREFFASYSSQARRAVVLDPIIASIIAATELAIGFIEATRAAGSAWDSVRDVMADMKRTLLSERVMPQEVAHWDFSSVNDFVAPAESDDQWPASIAEVEQVARRFMLSLLSNDVSLTNVKSQTWCIAAGRDRTFLCIHVPEKYCAPTFEPASRFLVTSANDRFALLTWLILPSTISDRSIGGYFGIFQRMPEWISNAI